MKCTELLSVLSIVIFFRNKSASHSEAEEGKGKKIAEFFSRKRNSALLLSKERGRKCIENCLHWFPFSFGWAIFPRDLKKWCPFADERVIMHHVLNQYVKEGEPSM